MTVSRPDTRVFGVLNVTPDSFSDGGDYLDPVAALARARQLVADGADIVDVGGESTRPGAARVSLGEEQRRVLPVVEALAAEGIAVSIDTVNADTARLAVAAGASIVNDVSGGTADPRMRGVIAETGADFVVMHWRGIPDPEHGRSNYSDVVAEVCAELRELTEAAIAEGVRAEQIIVDPGLGFDKTTEQGWQLLSSLSRLRALGYRVLIGVSRKRMLAQTLSEAFGRQVAMADRDHATAAVSALAAREGAWGVRVHEVAPTVAAFAVERAWRSSALDSDATPVATVTALSAEPRATTIARAEPLDRIVLTGLEVFAHHGVFDFEREHGQRFLIDAELEVDARQAAEGDDLARTVHYGELAEALVDSAQNDPVDLIETLAERLLQCALAFEGVESAKITVHKPDAPIRANFADVAVTMERRATRLPRAGAVAHSADAVAAAAAADAGSGAS